MRLLLDTHLLLWALAEPDRLDATTRTALEDASNEVLFSAASLWEIAIKAGLGRSDFAFDSQQILRAALQTGFVELPVYRLRQFWLPSCRLITAIPSIASSSPRP